MQSKIINGLEIWENGEIYSVEGNRRVLKQQYGVSRGNRYKVVSVTIDGKQKHLYVHRLVAEAFIPNPDNKEQVNHKDGNPQNNNVSNLEWVTSSENQIHRFRYLTKSESCIYCSGMTYSKRKICKKCWDRLRSKKNSEKAKKLRIKKFEKDVSYSSLSQREKEFYELYLAGFTQKKIAERYGITHQAVSAAIKKMRSKNDVLNFEQMNQD